MYTNVTRLGNLAYHSVHVRDFWSVQGCIIFTVFCPTSIIIDSNEIIYSILPMINSSVVLYGSLLVTFIHTAGHNESSIRQTFCWCFAFLTKDIFRAIARHAGYNHSLNTALATLQGFSSINLLAHYDFGGVHSPGSLHHGYLKMVEGAGWVDRALLLLKLSPL